MKKLTSIAFCLVALAWLLLATSANATDGVFITLETGWANQPGLPTAAMVGAQRRSQPGFPSAYRGAIGYNHDFLRWLGFGIETGFGYYGGTVYHFANGQVKIAAKTVEFLTRTMFHICHKYDAFITIGGIRHTSEITGLISAKGRMRIEPEIGIGGIYNCSRHIGFLLSYNHIVGRKLSFINGSELRQPGLNEVLAGIQIIFG